MTYVLNTPSLSLNANRRLKYFNVEIVTFNGDSYMEEIEARTSTEAAEIAASMYEDVDYVMVQGCVEF